MKKIISDSYDALEETLTHMKSTKIKSYLGEHVIYLWAMILVYSERLESAKAFNTENLGYITCIFEDNSDTIFRIWDI